MHSVVEYLEETVDHLNDEFSFARISLEVRADDTRASFKKLTDRIGDDAFMVYTAAKCHASMWLKTITDQFASYLPNAKLSKKSQQNADHISTNEHDRDHGR
jgi:hypothetical protein